MPPACASRSVERTGWADALLLVGLALALTLLFSLTPLDISAARLFYRPLALDHWPLAIRAPWSLLYQASSWITASLVLMGLGVLAVSVWRRRPMWRRHAVFILLSVVVGPGLLVNGVFKDHWDRPRPRDIIAFGGALHYTPAPLRGEGGSSFPCGHCSVGFLYALGWWIWRRRRPRLALASACAGTTLGLALGLGRMAAGGHFLSDVLWSGLLAFGVAHLLYHYVLRIPLEAARVARGAPTVPASRPRQLALALVAALGGATVLIALFAAPHGTRIATLIPLASQPQAPQVLEVQAAAADIDLTLVDTPADTVAVSGELHGFGLPTSQLSARSTFVAAPAPTLLYRIVQRGWFTDLDSNVVMQIPADHLRRLIVRIGRGDIRVADRTRTQVTHTGRLALDLQTRSGFIQRP